MASEIEHKFLVTGDGYRRSATGVTRIVQGYLSDEVGRTVRVRIRNERAFLTVKGPSESGGVSRYEFETEVPLTEAQQMLRLCLPGVIDKHRYLVPHGGHVWEVDEFHGDNEGLVVAEVELGRVGEAFERPDFVGREVTGDVRYYNSQLRKRPFRLWQGDADS